ncbi:MAG: YcgL domain-containing protein [Spongiibacteraceae bacterium]|jgi:uncharacterized protein YcgL (UPF0745 family)|nr:YcgL domain-containing protein [Spongiibacteraceae bacterium]
MKKLCAIYRSTRVAEMYLYVEADAGLERVPEALLDRFGAPQLVMKLALSEARPLARADVKKVLQDIDENGFFLQVPPPPEAYMGTPSMRPERLA